MKIRITKEFEVDPKIAHAIILLNDKGYKTDFCCSGHPEELFKFGTYNGVAHYSMGTYVCFKDRKLMTDCPDNWFLFDNGAMYRFFTQEEIDIFRLDQLIDLAMKELLNFAKKLPSINDYDNLYEEIKYEIIE